jgi:tRNA(fMet)-specific endonuclease VapC
MSLYVFDTDCVTLLLYGHTEICQQAAARDPAEMALSIVTVEETLTGWYSQIRRAKKDDQLIRAYAALQQAVEFCARVRILPFDREAVRRFHELRVSKRRLATNDLKIAAVVLGHDAVLITRNVRDFKGVPGLRVEDWCRVQS